MQLQSYADFNYHYFIYHDPDKDLDSFVFLMEVIINWPLYSPCIILHLFPTWNLKIILPLIKYSLSSNIVLYNYFPVTRLKMYYTHLKYLSTFYNRFYNVLLYVASDKKDNFLLIIIFKTSVFSNWILLVFSTSLQLTQVSHTSLTS